MKRAVSEMALRLAIGMLLAGFPMGVLLDAAPPSASRGRSRLPATLPA